MRKKEMTIDDMKRELLHKYEIAREIIEQLPLETMRWTEIDKAALYSVLSKKSILEILEIRKTLPWERIRYTLGLMGGAYDEAYFSHRANRLHRFYGIDEERAKNLLEQGYPNHWIRLAYLLETKGFDVVEDILAQRTKSVKWKPWIKETYNIDEETFKEWILETRNPALAPK